MKQKVISSLNALGLTQYESRVYATLVRESVATAKDVSNACNIPYGKVYEILASLTSKGFVSMFPTKPMRYKAISPGKIIKLVKEEELEKIETAAKVIKEELSHIVRGNELNGNQNVFWVINGKYAIIKKIEEMIKNAKNKVLVFMPGESFSSLDDTVDLIENACKKGVHIEIATDSPRKDLPRVCNVFNIKFRGLDNFILVDDKEVLLFDELPHEEDYGGVMSVHSVSHSFVKLIKVFFKLMRDSKNGKRV